LKISRPEEYANLNLKKSLKIRGISIEEIHDKRVYIRKYFDILSALNPLYEDIECLALTKDVISDLGKVRDMDITGCYNKKRREEIALRAIRKADKLKNCFLPKVYGSRLVVFNNILRLYNELRNCEEFHQLRKNVRIIRNLAESLNFNNEIKKLAKEMGDLRDEALRKTNCLGVINYSFNINEYRRRAIEYTLKIILQQDEFHHY
jgi:CHAD domain-containing protein